MVAGGGVLAITKPVGTGTPMCLAMAAPSLAEIVSSVLPWWVRVTVDRPREGLNI